ncbi:hypothetical protein J3Q64DRAFT_1820489 [Phycomyces blakesleeanus]|uniref:TRP C-terminal domain-containing protein n=1 Tax=Phycomyces blakesleeanus TaxID=4837 RepID=A0ABR3B3Z6_PHYBL
MIITLVILGQSKTKFGLHQEIGYKHIIAKENRIMIESIWFFLYEIWRFWLAFDGVLHSNSLTVSASFISTLFAIALGSMQIAEFIKLDEATKLEIIPQIVMVFSLTIISAPTLYISFKLYRDCDWIKYRKLGPEVRLHHMYHWVQCFVLALKVDIFFQIFLTAYYTVLSNLAAYKLWILVCLSVLPAACLVFIIIGRKSIANESMWLMSLFILYQIGIILLSIGVLAVAILLLKDDAWYFLYAYVSMAILMCLITISLSIRCLMNFNKGLYKHVQIGMFGSKQDSNPLERNQNSVVDPSLIDTCDEDDSISRESKAKSKFPTGNQQENI